MNKLLIIGYVWPEPNSSAAGLHMQTLMEVFISMGWHITFSSPAALSEHMLPLQEMGIDQAEIVLNCNSFDDFVRELAPDAVVFDRYMMEEQFGWRVAEHCPNALRILETCDLACLRDARQQHFKKHQRINPEITQSLLFTEMAQREIAAIHRCDLSLIISEVEMDILRDLFRVDPGLLVYYPFLLDPVTPAEKEKLPSFEERQHFISIGNFRHAPNWDAVRFLKESLWPLIRKQLPKAELHIYGAYPPPKATALHNAKQGFLVKGWADSASEVMQQARINLAPVRFGAGLKGKLSDGMSYGTPSITTSIGAEGLNAELSWGGAISDDAQTLADAAVALYNNPAQWYEQQAQGFAVHNQRFNKTTHAVVLRNAIESTQNNLAQHRLNNFTGAMLQHHTLKSTKYMSQWIAEKNKKENKGQDKV